MQDTHYNLGSREFNRDPRERQESSKIGYVMYLHPVGAVLLRLTQWIPEADRQTKVY